MSIGKNHHFPSPADDGNMIEFEVDGVKLIGIAWVVDILFDVYKVTNTKPTEYVKGFCMFLQHQGKTYPFFVVDQDDLPTVLWEMEEFEECTMRSTEEFMRPLFDRISDSHSNELITG